MYIYQLLNSEQRRELAQLGETDSCTEDSSMEYTHTSMDSCNSSTERNLLSLRDKECGTQPHCDSQNRSVYCRQAALHRYSMRSRSSINV